MIQNIDFAILDWIQAHLRSRSLDWLMPRLTVLGSGGALWIALTVFFLLWKRHRKCSLTMGAGLVCSLLLGNLLLKPLVARARPCWLNPEVALLVPSPGDYSFPSGHTLASFICAGILLRYDRRLGVPALLISLGIAFSRLYLYVHFPTDVLAGVLLGLAIALGVSLAMERLLGRDRTE